VLISCEFQTAGAAVENAREEKRMLTCGRCSSGAEAERDRLLLLDDTPQFHCKDMTVVQFVLHEKLLLQSCRLFAV